MRYYYVALGTRSHAFLLERRLKDEGIECELTYMPRELIIDLCNMGVRFEENEFHRAMNVIRYCGLPGCKVYKELMYPSQSAYQQIF